MAPIVDAEDLAGISYSGGTTGKPKGIMSTYRGGTAMTAIQLGEWQWPDEVRFLICTPLSHAGAAFFTPTLLKGGSLTVLPGFDPETFMQTIETHRITATMLVPTMIYVLLDHPKFDQYDLSSLQTVFYGASAASPTRLAEAVRRMGPIFFQFYGQAECPMAITSLRKEDHDPENLERLASCGRPTPWVHVALLDDDGNEVPQGEPGEICVRGPLVMKGYLGKPEQTAEAFAHGWLHTGDVARADDEGFLYIVDRKKDMIITGGFNVYPREVEDVISTHPGVSAVAVIGVPDERWGESVKAVVVPRPGPRGRRRRAHCPGEGPQGVGAGPEVGRLRRRHPAVGPRQARQEGAPGPLLGRLRAPGELTSRRRVPPAATAAECCTETTCCRVRGVARVDRL